MKKAFHNKKKCYSLSLANSGDLSLTRAFKSSPFKIQGASPERDIHRSSSSSRSRSSSRTVLLLSNWGKYEHLVFSFCSNLFYNPLHFSILGLCDSIKAFQSSLILKKNLEKSKKEKKKKSIEEEKKYAKKIYNNNFLILEGRNLTRSLQYSPF